MKPNKYALEDHLCRFCAGRILQYLGPVVTGGGNPVYECSSCGITCSDMSPKPICWCGQNYNNKGVNSRTYLCYKIPTESEILPEERRALNSMGFRTKDKEITTRIGVVLFDVYTNIISPAKKLVKNKK